MPMSNASSDTPGTPHRPAEAKQAVKQEARYGRAFLQAHGKRIVPVHPTAPIVLGEQGYATLADVPFPIDVVDVFRRSEAAGEYADQAVAVGARAVWFQLGVIDEDAFERTWAAGVPMVMDTCPAIEWAQR